MPTVCACRARARSGRIAIFQVNPANHDRYCLLLPPGFFTSGVTGQLIDAFGAGQPPDGDARRPGCAGACSAPTAAQWRRRLQLAPGGGHLCRAARRRGDYCAGVMFDDVASFERCWPAMPTWWRALRGWREAGQCWRRIAPAWRCWPRPACWMASRPRSAGGWPAGFAAATRPAARWMRRRCVTWP